MNIETMRERLDGLKHQRDKLELGIVSIKDAATVETRELTDDETKAVDEAFDAAEALDPEILKLEDEIKVEEDRDARLQSVMNRAQAMPSETADQKFARPRDPSKGEKPYRSDRPAQGTGHGTFLRDIYNVRFGDVEARERLTQNNRAVLEMKGYEERDMSTTATAGGDFLNPIYLPELAVHIMTAGRPLADALPKYPLPPTGITATLPSFDSGVTVAARADNGAVSETDGVTSTKTHYVNEYAGQVDVGRIEIMRSLPAFDVEVTNTLIKRYNVKIDTHLFVGSAGATPREHQGLDNLTSPNTTTWTTSTPTGAGFLGQVYKSIAAIDTTRLEADPDLIVLHGRRAAWAAGGSLSSTFPLIQQSVLFQALGTQDGGFTETIAGLTVVKDNNITSTAGAATNEDKVYLLYKQDFLLAEGPLYTRIFDDVGSGTGTIRYQVFAHSLFLGDRYPKSLCIMSGTGLVAPTFGS